MLTWLVLALLTGRVALADVPSQALTLDEAISEAKEKSPDLKAVQASQKAASWRPLEALSANLPHFGVNANHLFDAKFQVEYVAAFNTSFPEIAPYTIASLGVAWTVFDGFQGWNAYRAAKQGAEAADLQLGFATYSLDQAVRLRFYQALGAQILADVAEENVKTLQDHLEKTREILSRGSATRYDLLRVQVQLEEASSDKDAADDNVVLARKALAQQMGLEDDQRRLVGELPVPDESRIPAGLKPDFSNRQDLQALVKQATAAHLDYASALGAWAPKVTLTAEKDYYDNLNNNVVGTPYSDAYALGIQLSWNFLDGGATYARQREAGYKAEQADAVAESIALRAPQQFETYRRRYIYNSALYRAKKRAVEMAEESVRLARLGYEAGTRTSTDVLDAELDLIRARADVVKAQVNGAQALIDLELALGKVI